METVNKNGMLEFVVRFASSVMVLGIGIVSVAAPKLVSVELSIAAGVCGVLMLIETRKNKKL